MEYKNEVKKIKSRMSPDLWDMLADQGCIIAGGAVTSVFTNKDINDIDVYFPSKEAFSKVIKEIYSSTDGLEKEGEYSLGYADARVNHVSKKAVLLHSDQQEVQLIGHQFFGNAQDIFKSFDFSINMGAIYMYDGRVSLDAQFLKHNAQKYLHFNPQTTYPLISALRVDKYRQRGYTISKAQMLRVLLAVNNKCIDNWETLMDELGGMYGTPPEEIFDTSKPFNLDDAIAALDGFEIKDIIVPNNPTIDDVILTLKTSITDDLVNLRKEYYSKNKWRKNPYDPAQPVETGAYPWLTL